MAADIFSKSTGLGALATEKPNAWRLGSPEGRSQFIPIDDTSTGDKYLLAICYRQIGVGNGENTVAHMTHERVKRLKSAATASERIPIIGYRVLSRKDGVDDFVVATVFAFDQMAQDPQYQHSGKQTGVFDVRANGYRYAPEFASSLRNTRGVLIGKRYEVRSLI